jgi:hypothetical protein
VAYSRPWPLGLFQLPCASQVNFHRSTAGNGDEDKDTIGFHHPIFSPREIGTTSFHFLSCLWRSIDYRWLLLFVYHLILTYRVANCTRPVIYPTTILSHDTKYFEVAQHSTQSTRFVESTRLSFINLAGPAAASIVHLFNCLA